MRDGGGTIACATPSPPTASKDRGLLLSPGNQNRRSYRADLDDCLHLIRMCGALWRGAPDEGVLRVIADSTTVTLSHPVYMGALLCRRRHLSREHRRHVHGTPRPLVSFCTARFHPERRTENTYLQAQRRAATDRGLCQDQSAYLDFEDHQHYRADSSSTARRSAIASTSRPRPRRLRVYEGARSAASVRL